MIQKKLRARIITSYSMIRLFFDIEGIKIGESETASPEKNTFF